MGLTVHQFPCLQDNYGFLVRDARSGMVACIDPPLAEPVLKELQSLEWELDLILNTHWHRDHTGGNEALRAATGAKIIAPEEVGRTTAVDRIVWPAECVALGTTVFQVLDTGGHTMQHVSYHAVDRGLAFVGDTLFAMGCGRIFEGTPQQMWTSLQRLAALPPATLIYCAHEYTAANGRFAINHDPSPAVLARYEDVLRQRASGVWTVPTTIERELATNPFLRAPQLRPDLDPVEAFAAVRRAKDAFVG